MIDQCLPFLNFDQDYLIAREGYTEPEDDEEKEGFDTEYQGWGRGVMTPTGREAYGFGKLIHQGVVVITRMR